MPLASPKNARALAYLARHGARGPALAGPGSVADPYYGCGCHPDVVDRIWDQIGKALPRDCRGIVHGTPALVLPGSLLIVALGIGTQYALRLPARLVGTETAARLPTRTTWASGDTFDAAVELGEDWVLGSWDAEEPHWARQLFEEHERSA